MRRHPERRPVVVAGASSGIGAATAEALARVGHPVALGARRVERCEEIAGRLRAEGAEAVALPLDVADSGSVDAFVKEARARLGEIEAVVGSAAVLVPGATYEMDADQVAREFEVNVLGVQRLVRAFVPGMVERRRGDFVFVSSDVANRARPFMSAYTSTKWAVEGIAHALQMELEGTGVRASIVRPGPTHSEMGTDWDGPAAERVITEWIKWGHARHPRLLPAAAVGDAITAIVDAPPGTHISLIEVSPEAPLEEK